MVDDNVLVLLGRSVLTPNNSGRSILTCYQKSHKVKVSPETARRARRTVGPPVPICTSLTLERGRRHSLAFDNLLPYTILPAFPSARASVIQVHKVSTIFIISECARRQQFFKANGRDLILSEKGERNQTGQVHFQRAKRSLPCNPTATVLMTMWWTLMILT